MTEHAQDTATGRRETPSSRTKVYRSVLTGRVVSQGERIAAAQTRVIADKRRGVTTEQWIVNLANQSA